MSISNVSSSSKRNYTDMLEGKTSKTTASGKAYDAVFSNEDKSNLGVSDFFNLMITQLTNQDFTKPVDDTQYVSQLAQFSTLTAMKELSDYSKQNYILSLLGKNCTATTNNIGGEAEKTTGNVTSISLVDNDYKLTINGKQFSMSEITSVNNLPDSKETK
ncbi:MAG: flagellar hook capping protein [Ruminococcus sp.]|jgi:flagellar basal-body rod modification protein FlgD|nr:flagellar hook capping protein [Ruminococcus sp.]